jgi:hypothetical protein
MAPCQATITQAGLKLPDTYSRQPTPPPPHWAFFFYLPPPLWQHNYRQCCSASTRGCLPFPLSKSSATPRSRGVVLPCSNLGQPVAARPRWLWLGGSVSPASGPRLRGHPGGLPRWGWAPV